MDPASVLPSSSSVRPSTFSNIFSSETAWPIKAKFYVEPPWEGGTKVYINGPRHMCGTVSSMLSGLKTRSLGLNTLGTTLSPASSQSVQVGRPSTASWVQPVLSKVNVTCSRPQRNVHWPGFEPGTLWSEIRRPNHCATPPPVQVT